MPTYLCHGFRWQRRSILVFVILQNLEDASPEWIVSAKGSQCILNGFYEIFDFLPDCSPARGSYPPTGEVSGDDDDDAGRTGPFRPGNGSSSSLKDRSQSRGRVRGRSQSQSTHQSRSHSGATQRRVPSLRLAADDGSRSTTSSTAPRDALDSQSWSAVKLLEEYDPNDLTAVSQPYAYVVDYAVRIDLSCSIVDEIAKYEQQQAHSPRPAVCIPRSKGSVEQADQGWFEDLRDELQREEEIRWYVVVNDDEVRDWEDKNSEPESVAEQGTEDVRQEHRQHPPLQKQQQQVQSQPQPPRRAPSQKQKEHHEQYVNQQRMFEEESQDQQRPQQQRRLTFQGSGKGLALGKNGRGQVFDEEQQKQLLLQERHEKRRRREAQERKQQKQEQQGLGQRDQDLLNPPGKDRRPEKTRNREEQDRPRDPRPPMPLGAPPPPPPPPPPQINHPDTSNKPPSVPEKDYRYSHPPPPTSNPRTTPTTTSTTTTSPPMPQVAPPLPPPPPPPDAPQPKAPGGKRGLRRLFSRSKFSVE